MLNSWTVSRLLSASRMKHVATILNSVLVALSGWGGYRAMSPENLLHMNPDWIFCSVIFVTVPLFVLVIVQYSISRKKQTALRRPAWDRFSINWWHDPLQCLFLSTFLCASTVCGSALRLFGTSSTGVWTFISYLSTLWGLLIGQYLVYRLHRERIHAA